MTEPCISDLRRNWRATQSCNAMWLQLRCMRLQQNTAVWCKSREYTDLRACCPCPPFQRTGSGQNEIQRRWWCPSIFPSVLRVSLSFEELDKLMAFWYSALRFKFTRQLPNQVSAMSTISTPEPIENMKARAKRCAKSNDALLLDIDRNKGRRVVW